MKPNTTLKLIAAVLTVALSPLAHATQVPGVAEQPDSYFYTGKPYDADLGGYTFAYRTYDPQVNRWTSADPSGFPDGANQNRYACTPTWRLDPTGCFSINVTNSAQYSSSYGGHTIHASDITKVDGLSANSSAFLNAFRSDGWTFHNIGSDLTVNITDYTATAGPASGDLLINASVAGTTPASHQYEWLQIVTTSNDLNTGMPGSRVDTGPSGNTTPMYPTDEAGNLNSGGVFHDDPSRPWPGEGHTTEWKAALYLVDYNSANKTINLLGGFSYGFQLE